MTRARCITLTVNGVPVRARVSGRLTDRDREALEELARAAMRFRPADAGETTIHTGRATLSIPKPAKERG